MKASLEADGTLIISAENGLEAFALKAWAADYFAHTSIISKDDEAVFSEKASLLIGVVQEDKVN